MFRLNSNLPIIFYDAPDALSGGGNTFDELFSEVQQEQETAEETIDLSGTSDVEEADEEETEEKNSKTDDNEEEEFSLEGKDQEEVALQTVPNRKQILKDFPELFKKYPGIEAAIYRDRQYSEIFPTPQEAQESLDKSSAYDNISSELMEGSAKNVFAGVKDEDPEAFNRIVDNLLPDLYNVDREAYYHVIGVVTSDIIGKMVKVAKGQNNEALGIAAQVLNQFVYGTDEYVPAQKLAKQLQQDDNVRNEREQFARERFETTVNELTTRTDNTLKAGISKALDPKNQLTDYVKRVAVKECFDECEKIISQDTAFRKIINGMWKRVIANNYDKAGVDKIQKAYLSKASEILPKLIAKHRNAAVKGMGKYVRPNTDRKGPISPGRSTSRQGGNVNVKEQASKIPAGMSSADFLLQD